MKQNRKGFSLVELIVVLVIMAIIAALCAPNISAYVQAAKIQNYQTVANNLADELQTQLPQSRYWNWDEVQQSAEGILRSDAGRSVTPLESGNANVKKYQITGASNDTNAVFTVTLTYQPAEKTSQKVDIAVSCDGYTAAQAEQKCSLVLKTNYTDASAYPQQVVNQVTTSSRKRWVSLLDDRVKTMEDWDKAFQDGLYPDNNFKDKETVGNGAVFNVTDYPVNTISYVQFNMKRWTPTTWNSEVYMPIWPCVWTQDGIGTGSQYAACGTEAMQGTATFEQKFKNVLVLVDGDASDENSWVSYTDLFDESHTLYNSETPGLSASQRDNIKKYLQKYNNDSTDTVVTYRVKMVDPTSSREDAISSRGWISVFGRSNGDNSRFEPSYHLENRDDGKTVKVYDNAAVFVNQPDMIENLSEKIMTDETTNVGNGEYFDTSDVPEIKLDTEKSNEWVKTYQCNSYYFDYYSTYIRIWLEGYQNWSRYITLYSNGSYDVSGVGALDASEQDCLDKIKSCYKCLQTGYMALDLSESGYSVGDVIKITFSNVDVDRFGILMSTTLLKDQFESLSSLSAAPNSGHTFEYYGRISTDSDGNVEMLNKSQIEFNTLDSTASIYVKLKWNDYPYFLFRFTGAKANYHTISGISASWSYRGTTTSVVDVTTDYPALTLNGDNTYTNITLDWTKCDYITNVGEIGVQFDKYPSNLTYDVYSKDYTLLASGQSLSKFMMSSNSAVTSSAAADKIVHLYCKGMSPDEISCSVVAPKAPVTTGTTTTTPTTTTTSTETETTAKTTSAAETTSTSASSTTTTTTTTTSTTTTSTTTETSATTTTTTTTATTSTSATTTTTSSTTTTSATETSSTSSSSSTTSTTTTSSSEESGVVTTVVTGVNFNQEIPVPNYKLLIGVEIELTGDTSNCGGELYLANFDGSHHAYNTNTLVNNKFYSDIPSNELDSTLTVTSWGQSVLLKSVTFYYRNPNVTITNKLPDGYTINKESGTALLDSSYEFTVTWNPEEYRTPTVKWNGVTMIPINKEDDKATYTGKIDGDVEIVVSGRKEDLSGNTLVIDDFNYGTEYDISKYWYIDEDGNGQIPKEIQIEFSDGNYNLRAVLSADKFKTTWGEGSGIFEYCASKNSNGGETYVISSDVISKISMIKNAKIKFDNWGSNAKVEAIKFVYADNSELAKAARYMSRKENIAAILDSELSRHTVTTSARETSFTTPPQTTTTTTTTAKPIAASENGKNVGLDETSAAGCDITFSESLFNDSGVCYFTITPKAGYTLSDGYTVKVGTEVLSPKNNYNPKTGQWFFWSNKSMTDYTIHVEGISPAA